MCIRDRLGSDLPLLLGITVVTAAIVFAGNLIADLLYGVVDPKIRRGAARDVYKRQMLHRAIKPKLSLAPSLSLRAADKPTPSAMMKGTVIGPVVTPPASNATAINSEGAKKDNRNSSTFRTVSIDVYKRQPRRGKPLRGRWNGISCAGIADLLSWGRPSRERGGAVPERWSERKGEAL